MEVDFNTKIAMRDGYGEALLDIGKNKNIIVLTNDLRESLRLDWFKKKYSKRFLECGISEANMVSVAAGLASIGKIPFVSSFGVFSVDRAFDQIRVSVAYSNLNVKIIGSNLGIEAGEDGATHQAIEDIALIRSLPNFTIIAPCDYLETKKAVKEMMKIKGPCYLRITRNPVSVITNKKDKFVIGKCNVIKKGKDLTIIAHGSMVSEALKVAIELELKNKLNISVINCHTIKPLDTTTILEYAKKTKAFVVAEDHQFFGGLGSAISELIAKQFPIPIEFISIKDRFGQSGSVEELMKEYKLTSSDIEKACFRVLRRKT